MNSYLQKIIPVMSGESFGQPLEFQALPLCYCSKGTLPVIFKDAKCVHFIVDNASKIHKNYTVTIIGCIYVQLAPECMHSSSGFPFDEPQLSHDLLKKGYKIPDGAI